MQQTQTVTTPKMARELFDLQKRKISKSFDTFRHSLYSCLWAELTEFSFSEVSVNDAAKNSNSGENPTANGMTEL